MTEIFDSIYFSKGAMTLILAVAVLLLTRAAVSVVRRRGSRIDETPHAIRYAGLCAFVAGLVFIWFEGFTPLFTALTFVAAALTIASKELILNFVGSFVIFWREPFAIGDRVQVGTFAGDVMGKGLLYFTLLETGDGSTEGQNTGRLVKVPNALVLTQPVTNASRGSGYVWNELSAVATFGSDRNAACVALLDSAADYATEMGFDPARIKSGFERKDIYFKHIDPQTRLSLAKTGVRVTLRYLCRARKVRESEHFIMERFLNRLEPGVVELADDQS